MAAALLHSKHEGLDALDTKVSHQPQVYKSHFVTILSDYLHKNEQLSLFDTCFFLQIWFLFFREIAIYEMRDTIFLLPFLKTIWKKQKSMHQLLPLSGLSL